MKAAREYLAAIMERQKYIDQLHGDIAECRRAACSISAAAMGDDRTGRRRRSSANRQTAAVEKLERLEDALRAAAGAQLDSKLDLWERTAGLPMLERHVLLARYAAGMAWPEVARFLELSEGHVFRLHRRALASLGDTLQKNDTKLS